MNTPTIEALSRLEQSQIIWLASIRPDGRPHLVPVWYVWASQKIYICIDASSVKANNLQTNPLISIALEDGSRPVICEGRASPAISPWDDEVIAGFIKKYDWDITQDDQYTLLVEITPLKWLSW